MASSSARPRRFYTSVSVAPLDGPGYAVHLDERPLKSPGGAPLVLPNFGLAALTAEEWRRQAAEIDLHAMPVTRLAFAAFDRGETAQGALADDVARYAASDLLCYLAIGPDALVARQRAAWGPWLAWASEALGVELVQTQGVMPIDQQAQALTRVRALAAGMNAFEAMGLAHAAALLGSAVLAFALARGEIDGLAAHDLTRLDEAWQAAQWGVDAEAAALAQARLGEALMLERWFAALKASDRPL